MPRARSHAARAVALAAPVCILLYGAAIPIQRTLAADVRAAALDDAALARIRADRATVAALDPFAGHGASRDAGPLLDRATTPPAGTSWPDDVDPAVFAELLAFDHWDLPPADPLASLTDAPSPPSRLPRVLALLRGAQTRLDAALATGDPLPALREVRHLAALFYSTEAYIGAIAAGQALRAERDAADRAVREGLLAADAWRAATDAELAAYDRLVRDALALYAPGNARRAEALAGSPPVLECAALAEAIGMVALLRPSLERPSALDVDLSDDLRALGDALDRSGCRLAVARDVWAHPERAVTTGHPVSDLALHLPLWRPIPGLLGARTLLVPVGDEG